MIRYRRMQVREPLVDIPDGYAKARISIIWAVLLFLAFGLLFSFVMVMEDDQFPRTVMGSLALGVALIWVWIWVAGTTPRVGVVRVIPQMSLRFPRRVTSALIGVCCGLCWSFAGGLATAALFIPGLPNMLSTGRSSPELFVLVSFGLLGCAIAQLVKRYGIRLSADTAQWYGHHADAVVGWDEIESVRLTNLPRTRRLHIDTRDGRTHVLTSFALGSDPRIIAETMAYFLHHPEERHLLDSDPVAALALVIEPTPR